MNSHGGAAPEKAESGLLVAVSGRGWVLEHARGTSNPLGHSAGRCGVRGGARGGGGGSAQQSSPAATEGYGLRNCVKKVWGKRVGAHRGSNRVETSVGSWRRNSAAAHGRSRGRSSRSGWHWTPPGSWVARTAKMALRSRAKGQGGLRTTGGKELRRRRDLPPTGLG